MPTTGAVSLHRVGERKADLPMLLWGFPRSPLGRCALVIAFLLPPGSRLL